MDEGNMEIFDRKLIDWVATGNKLRQLRRDNIYLRRYICCCNGCRDCGGNCETCRNPKKAKISQMNMANVFHVSESSIVNWELARSIPPLEELMFYAQICRMDLTELIVFKMDGYPIAV